MSKHYFGEREVQKCTNRAKIAQNWAKTPSIHDGEAVYRRAQDQVNHVKMYVYFLYSNAF